MPAVCQLLPALLRVCFDLHENLLAKLLKVDVLRRRRQPFESNTLPLLPGFRLIQANVAAETSKAPTVKKSGR
jgi:hypothetical protein